MAATSRQQQLILYCDLKTFQSVVTPMLCLAWCSKSRLSTCGFIAAASLAAPSTGI